MEKENRCRNCKFFKKKEFVVKDLCTRYPKARKINSYGWCDEWKAKAAVDKTCKNCQRQEFCSMKREDCDEFMEKGAV